jgi:PAS domain-containing protein
MAHSHPGKLAEPDRGGDDVQRFVLQENLKAFRAHLAGAVGEDSRNAIQTMLDLTEAELARLETERGVLPPWQRIPAEELAARRATMRAWFHLVFDGSPVRASLIDPAPGLTIVDVSGSLELAPGRSRRELVGRTLLETFPQNPGGPWTRNAYILYSALRAAADTGLEQAIAPYRHDLTDASGVFVERHWRGVCRPVTDEAGRLIFLLGLMQDITGQALAASEA